MLVAAAEYPGSPRGVNQLGDELFLIGYSVTTTEKDVISLTVRGNTEAKSLQLRVDPVTSAVAFDMWFEAFRCNAEYAASVFFGEGVIALLFFALLVYVSFFSPFAFPSATTTTATTSTTITTNTTTAAAAATLSLL